MRYDLIVLGPGGGPAARAAAGRGQHAALLADHAPIPGVTILPGRTVWSVTPGFHIHALGPAGPETHHAPRLHVAPGRRSPDGAWTHDILRLLQAPHTFDAARHAWLPVLDAQGDTPIPGLSAAPAPHGPPPDWPGILAALPPGAPVCPCENLTRADIDHAIHQGARDVNQLKHFTRCGMGPCQGRACEELAAELVALHVGGRAHAGRWTVRPPLVPLPLAALTGHFAYADIPVPPPAPL